MRGDDALLKNRLRELAARAQRSGRPQYSDFLDLAEQDMLLRLPTRELACAYTLYGGVAGAERRVACFAEAEANPDGFPVCCLGIAPLQQRFAEALTHRDFLGSLLHLGVERRNLGDIVVRPEAGYLFCLTRIAPFICENLERVKHTAVRCAAAAALPAGALYRLEPVSLLVASPRFDAVLAQAFCLPRQESQALIRAGRAYIDGRVCENAAYLLRGDELVSLRGHGRFRFCGVERVNQKGKQWLRIEKYL